MQSINSFIAGFTGQRFGTVKIKNSYFLADQDISGFAKQNPLAVGYFLGEETKNNFRPSLNLLSLLAKQSNKRVIVNEKAEWLFICGRDVFEDSVTQWSAKSGLVLVQNSYNENLGLGIIKQQGNKKIIKNIRDIGDFLRRRDS